MVVLLVFKGEFRLNIDETDAKSGMCRRCLNNATEHATVSSRRAATRPQLSAIAPPTSATSTFRALILNDLIMSENEADKPTSNVIKDGVQSTNFVPFTKAERIQQLCDIDKVNHASQCSHTSH